MSAVRRYDAQGKPYWERADSGAVARPQARGALSGALVVPSVPSDEVRRETVAAAAERYRQGRR